MQALARSLPATISGRICASRRISVTSQRAVQAFAKVSITTRDGTKKDLEVPEGMTILEAAIEEGDLITLSRPFFFSKWNHWI